MLGRISKLAIVAVVATLTFGAQLGAAGTVTSQPLTVKSASLSQNGQQLVWKLTLTAPFSPAANAKAGRTLCLLLERPVGGAVTGSLCVIAPAGHKHAPRLELTRGTAKGHLVAAQISRSSSSSLTASFLPGSVGLGYSDLRWQVQNTLATPPCVPPAGDPTGCETRYPASPALATLHTPKLVGCVPSGPDLVFSGSASRHELALTFDDGPWPSPPSIDFVNTLARYHVPATFFEIGDQISEYDPTGSVERKMLADGDMIGDHTWTHPDMATLPPAQQTSELELTANAIKHATGFQPCLWRPPYGDISGELDGLARRLGFLTIYWDVDTVDYSLPGTATIYQRAVSGAHNGAIILQHFGGGPRYETLAAVPHEIQTLRARGYKFVNVAQLLGLKLIYK